MEEQKTKNDDTFVFDLERDMKNFAKKKEITNDIATKVAAIKNTLRKGGDSEEYDKLGAVLHGYNALMSVVDKKR
ncbi:MAG: DUF5398 family protein [Waddliaceae bacterium]|nr:DUF5398 family protein [Waddliaceae bacterium]